METLTHIANYLLAQSWQIALLVVVIAVLSRLLRSRSAHVRYLLWLIVLAKCLIPPLYTIPLAVLPEQEPVESLPASPMPEQTFTAKFVDRVIVEQPILPVARDRSPVVAKPVEQILTDKLGDVTGRQWLELGWIAGAIVFVLVALVKAGRTNSWLRKRRRQLPAKLQNRIDDFFSEAGITNIPKVWLVKAIGQPFVWGLVRGSIYLPANFATTQTAKCRWAVLGHELSHVLRFDAAVNLLQIIAQALYWFHPFVWWANKRVRAEREKCCDETAIARLNALPTDYSRAIVNTLIAEHKSTLPIPSLAIAGPVKNIEDRIKTIMKSGKKFYRRPTIITIVTVLLLAAIAVPTTLALTRRTIEESGLESSNPRRVSKLLRTLQAEKYSNIADRIIPMVEEIGDKEPISFLVGQLQSDSRMRRCDAALALELLGDKRGVPVIVKELSDNSYRPTEMIGSDGRPSQERQLRQDHYYAALLLGLVGDKRAVPALVEATKDDRINHRAAVSLGQVGDERAIPALAGMMEEFPQDRLWAGYGLAMLGEQQGFKVVIDTLNDKQQHWVERRHAIRALGELGDKQAVPHLIAALKDDHPNIRVSAVRALGAIGEVSTLPALTEALKDKSRTKVNAPTTVSEAAVKAIEQIKVRQEAGASWGEAVDGLRCRWLVPMTTVRAGISTTIGVEIENVSDKEQLWQCRTVHTWHIRTPGPQPESGSGVTPRFEVELGEGVRAATTEEAQMHHEGSGSATGYYWLSPAARMIITTQYPWPLTKSGPVEVHGYLWRENPGGGQVYFEGQVIKNRMTCPPLMLEVIDGVKRKVIEGLSLSLSCKQSRVQSPDDLKFTVVIENNSEKDLELDLGGSDGAFPITTLEMVCQESGPHTLFTDKAGWRATASVRQVIRSNEKMVKVVRPSECWSRSGGRQILSTGLYRVTAKVGGLTDQAEHGIISSKPLRVIILEWPWGPAVEHLQCRLRPEKVMWEAGNVPRFKVDILNSGIANKPVSLDGLTFTVEFDGVRYYDERTAGYEHGTISLAPGGRHNGVAISLHKEWKTYKGHRRPALNPGKHTIRVAFPFDIPSSQQVVSNPVEIEILPADVRSASGEKLRELGRGLLMYANDEQGGYPDTLRQLLKGDYIDREDLRWFDENVAYLAKGKTAMDRPGMPLAYDKTLLAKGNGTNVLYNDGHVGFVGAEEFKRIGIAGAEERSEPEPEGTGASEHITLRLIGPDGKAVAAAKVGSMVDWSGTGEAGQGTRVYLVGATSALVSGEDGIVVLEAESLFGNQRRGQGVPIYAYQEDSKLGGLIEVSPIYCGEQVELRLQPLCHVKGRLTSSDLKELGLALEWTNVYARWQQLRPFQCSSDSQRFEFHLPPGQYKLNAYGMHTYDSEVDLDIKPGQDALDLEIDLPADKLAGLIGKPAPKLRQIKGWKNGKATSLADLRGKAVLLDFWGYWCGPCIRQMPKLMELHDALSEKGLVIIAVHDDSVGSIEQMDARLTKVRERYWDGRDLPFLVALDGGGKIRIEGTDNTTQGATTATYGITAFPTTVLIDTDGNVVGKVSADNVEKEIERMLGVEAAPAWRKRFDEVYRLDDGQILRRIAPPFIQERAEYYRHEHSDQAASIPEPPDYFTFHWDGALVDWGGGFTDGERPLKAVLRHNLSMGRDTFEGPEELLEIDVQGDWIVRKDSSVEQRLEALEKILEDETGREIRFVKRRVKREVIVAGGRYRFRGLPGKGRHGRVYMYSDIFDPDSGGGGGTAKSVSEFLAALGNRVGVPVIDRTESSGNNTIVYYHHRSSRLSKITDKSEKAKKLEMLLANLTKQTDLQFKISTEPVEVWFVTEQRVIEAQPPSEAPEGLGYRHVPMTSEEVFGQRAAVVQERLNAREVVERFVAAAVAGEFVQAEKFARPGSAAREQIAELWQIEGGQDIRIVGVYADTAEALAISSVLKGEREEATIVVHLVNHDGAWLVDAVEHEAKAKAQETLAEFRREHPEAKMIAANVDEPVWGEAVEGVQCRLWPEKRTWKVGQTPKLRVDMRNEGTRELELFLANERWEIELDARWYRNRIPWLGDVIRLAFGPGQQHDNLAFPLWESAKLGWRAKYGDEPLEFLPGRHTVRVAFNIRPAEQETWSALRVVSNPVEMEILMAESEMDGGIESVEKLKLLGQAILVYSNDNENKYPESLHQLREDNYIGEVDLQWLIENVEYLGKGKNAANLPDVVIAYDRTFLLEIHEGTNVLFNDSHVAFSSRDEFERLGIIGPAKERLGIIRPAKDRLAPLRGRSTSQVYRVLDRTVDLSHWRPEMSFAEALDSIRNSVEPPVTIVVLWGDLAEKADIDRTTPIYIDGVSAIRLGAALRLLLRAVSAGATELGYVVKDGVIIIATKKSLPKIMETRVYDLYGAEKPVINIETRVVLVTEQLLEGIGLYANFIAQATVARVPDDRGRRPQ
jgi:prepilin-type processing-associated H-X9-DG protein